VIRRVENLSPGLTLLAVAFITAVGVLLRVVHFGFPLYGDELSTLWIVQDRSLGDAIDLIRGDAEITPPLYFVAAWFATRLGEAPELVRLPAMLAGVASIPMTYLLGLRTLGKTAGLAGAAIFALSPFMTYFSADGRAYSLMIFLLLASALAMLAEIRTDRRRWWIAFGAASVLAMYSHYTAGFVLAAMFGWLFLFHPGCRRAGFVTLGLSVLAYLPWLASLRADLDSPTTPILESIQGAGFTAKRVATEQVLAGHPLAEIQVVPGRVALAAICLGLLIALVAAAVRVIRNRESPPVSREFLLIAAITLATPVFELLLLLFGVDLFGARNLTGIWAGLPVLVGGVMVLARGVPALVAAVLVFGGFGAAAVKSAERSNVATGYAEAAGFIESAAKPADVVVDSSHKGYTPVEITPLGIQLDGGLSRYDLEMPTGSPPFLPYVSVVPDPQQLLNRAVADAASGGRIFLVTSRPPSSDPFAEERGRLPANWRILETRTWPGRNPVTVTVFGSGTGGGSPSETETEDQADHSQPQPEGDDRVAGN
jgi:hypothetical protein